MDHLHWAVEWRATALLSSGWASCFLQIKSHKHVRTYTLSSKATGGKPNRTSQIRPSKHSLHVLQIAWRTSVCPSVCLGRMGWHERKCAAVTFSFEPILCQKIHLLIKLFLQTTKRGGSSCTYVFLSHLSNVIALLHMHSLLLYWVTDLTHARCCCCCFAWFFYSC